MKRQSLRWIVTVIALVWAVELAGAAVVLVEKGRPKAVIVTFTDSPTCAEAARELQGYLKKMSEATLPIVTEVPAGTTNKVLLGLAEDLAGDLAKRKATKQLKRGGFWILAEQPRQGAARVVIAGRDKYGLQFGVYEFLESLGCRWYFPGELGENVPRRYTVRVGDQNEIHNPDFIKRSMWLGYRGRPEWQAQAYRIWYRRNKMDGVEVSMGHNIHRVIRPSEFGEEHPEYFPLLKGRRYVPKSDEEGEWQPCTSNPEVIEITARKVIEFFDERPDNYSFSLSPKDGYGWCECDRCTAQDSPEFRGSAERGKGRRMVIFSNAVAERLAKRHPDKYVCWYSYMATIDPPRDVKVHPNVVIALAHYSPFFDSIHALQDPSSVANRGFVKLVNDWSRLTDKLFIREYWTIADGLARTCPAYSLAENIPFYKKKGVIGFSSGATADHGGAALNFWLAGRKMWDAEADLEELLTDFYKGMYGPAEPAMRRYFETTVKVGRKHGRTGSFTEEEFQRLGAMLDKAERLCRTEKQRGRVKMTRDYYDYALGIHQYLVAPSSAKAKAVNALVEDIERRQSFAVDFMRHKPLGQELEDLGKPGEKYCGVSVKPYSKKKMPQRVKKLAFRVRSRHTFVALLRAGEELSGKVQVKQLGGKLSSAFFAVLGPDKEKLLEGTVAVGKTEKFRVKAKKSGLHVIAVNTGGHGVSVFVENQYFCLVGRDLGLLYAQPRAHFFVSPEAQEINVALRSSAPGETGSMAVYNPDGKKISSGDTVSTGKVEVKAKVEPGYRGKAWSFVLDEARSGTLEDLSLELGAGCGEFLATDPTRLIVLVE